MLITLNPKDKTRITVSKDASGFMTICIQGYTEPGDIPYDRYIVDAAIGKPIELIIETEEVK